jgi:hypothetical protein
MPKDLSATISFPAAIRPNTLHAANNMVPGTANRSAFGVA